MQRRHGGDFRLGLGSGWCGRWRWHGSGHGTACGYVGLVFLDQLRGAGIFVFARSWRQFCGFCRIDIFSQVAQRHDLVVVVLEILHLCLENRRIQRDGRVLHVRHSMVDDHRNFPPACLPHAFDKLLVGAGAQARNIKRIVNRRPVGAEVPTPSEDISVLGQIRIGIRIHREDGPGHRRRLGNTVGLQVVSQTQEPAD